MAAKGSSQASGSEPNASTTPTPLHDPTKNPGKTAGWSKPTAPPAQSAPPAPKANKHKGQQQPGQGQTPAKGAKLDAAAAEQRENARLRDRLAELTQERDEGVKDASESAESARAFAGTLRHPPHLANKDLECGCPSDSRERLSSPGARVAVPKKEG